MDDRDRNYWKKGEFRIIHKDSKISVTNPLADQLSEYIENLDDISDD